MTDNKQFQNPLTKDFISQIKSPNVISDALPASYTNDQVITSHLYINRIYKLILFLNSQQFLAINVCMLLRILIRIKIAVLDKILQYHPILLCTLPMDVITVKHLLLGKMVNLKTVNNKRFNLKIIFIFQVYQIEFSVYV